MNRYSTIPVGWTPVNLEDLPNDFGAVPPTLIDFQGLHEYFNREKNTFRVITYRNGPGGDYYIKVVDDSHNEPVQWYTKKSSIFGKVFTTFRVATALAVWGLGTVYLTVRG